MANKSYHELTDEKWKMVEKILPSKKSKGRPQTDNCVDLKSKVILADKAYSTAKIRGYLENYAIHFL